ncbi:hypothetical protein N7495_004240 [Penicillium taxi]|uniref:uncharacterized protein n=1 Tax=Penicillium taxi TaxID=168475 RepID=UPI0025458DB7|nr:uncharacterized protein N7495_004240 [Penicillium taxi]KAJ5899496.1 hypothetical protein N7495_004240 [Penicillium taxi]
MENGRQSMNFEVYVLVHRDFGGEYSTKYPRAIDTMKSLDHNGQRLNILGLGYYGKYERTGAETDLQLAIQHYQEAVEATPVDYLECAQKLNSLGLGYRAIYKRTGAETDLQLVIR